MQGGSFLLGGCAPGDSSHLVLLNNEYFFKNQVKTNLHISAYCVYNTVLDVGGIKTLMIKCHNVSNGWCRWQTFNFGGRVLLAVWLRKALGRVSLLVLAEGE